MSLTLIIGPMKSSKSLELIARTEPYKHAGKKVVYIKPSRDVRTGNVRSRLGPETAAFAFKSLIGAGDDFDVVAVDEAHMFPPEDADVIKGWLDRDKIVLCSGLNTDHSGKLMPTVARILELSPETLINKQAVCENCKGAATHTQVLDRVAGIPVPKTMTPELPDDGSFEYRPVCRRCFM